MQKLAQKERTKSREGLKSFETCVYSTIEERNNTEDGENSSANKED